MRYHLLTLMIAFALGTILCAGCHSKSEDAKRRQASADHKRVSIRLLGPAEEINGIEVPKGLETRSDTYLHVNGDTDVSLAIPESRAIQAKVKYVSVNVDHGIVVDVHLLPQTEAVGFRQAVEDLQLFMLEHGIQPDQQMRAKMDAWPDDSRDLTYRAETKLTDSVAFLATIRPTDNGRHLLALNFAADDAARRAVANGAFKPTPKDDSIDKLP